MSCPTPTSQLRLTVAPTPGGRSTGALHWALEPAGDLDAWNAALDAVRQRMPTPLTVTGPDGSALLFRGPDAAVQAAVWALDRGRAALCLPTPDWGLVVPDATRDAARWWWAWTLRTLADAGRAPTLYAEPLLL